MNQPDDEGPHSEPQTVMRIGDSFFFNVMEVRVAVNTRPVLVRVKV
jgi:hypothetical protein